VNPLAKLLEAALFASPRPIPAEELAALDPEASPAAVQSALDELREHYDVDGHGVALVPVAEGWQILTRPEYTEAIERAQMAVRPQRLSAAALETLAIIAYRQPIGRAEVAEIRGVDVGAVLKNLHERGLVDVVGRAEGLGRPLLYGTTPLFLEQFGLRHLEELPRVDELLIALRTPGAAESAADSADAPAGAPEGSPTAETPVADAPAAESPASDVPTPAEAATPT
jgi:segregation and condensation protein B